MARWRVTAKHYINARMYGEPTQWVREETNRDTGRAFRKTFDVPLYIDPEDPLCINRNVGFCVVATEGSEMPGDIVMLGVPTPDMEPLDDEARVITKTESAKWKDPINSLPISIGDDFGNQLLAALTSQFNSLPKEGGGISLKGTDPSVVDELKAMIAKQQEQINALLGAKATPAEDPLPEIDPEAPAIPPNRIATRAGRRA